MLRLFYTSINLVSISKCHHSQAKPTFFLGLLQECPLLCCFGGFFFTTFCSSSSSVSLSKWFFLLGVSPALKLGSRDALWLLNWEEVCDERSNIKYCNLLIILTLQRQILCSTDCYLCRIFKKQLDEKKISNQIISCSAWRTTSSLT